MQTGSHVGQGQQQEGNQVRQPSKEWNLGKKKEEKQFSLEKIQIMEDKKEKALHCPQRTANVKQEIVVFIYLGECAD